LPSLFRSCRDRRATVAGPVPRPSTPECGRHQTRVFFLKAYSSPSDAGH
jgi:hypothetical protein